jgi:hypothetical protein
LPQGRECRLLADDAGTVKSDVARCRKEQSPRRGARGRLYRAIETNETRLSPHGKTAETQADYLAGMFNRPDQGDPQ